MQTLKLTFWTAVLALGLAACSGDPMKPVMEALKAGDLGKAELLSDALKEAKPDLLPLRAVRFALFRHQSVHGAAEKQQAYVQRSIAEYDALAQALSLKPDYANMEESLRSNPEGKKLLQMARGPLYGE